MHRLVLVQPTLLLQLVRERVTATVVLQRHVPIAGRRGLRVIARRAPGGDRAVTWVYEFDEGVDPADPAVRAAADAARPWPRTRSATRPPDFLRTPAPC